MRVFLIGGVGAMGFGTASDLLRGDLLSELVLADVDSYRIKESLETLRDPRVKGMEINARDTKALAGQLKGYDICANAASHTLNLDIMRACLDAGVHYVDLGGLFHFSRKQLELDQQFKDKKLTAVVGMGAAPGTTSILAGWCGQRLDTVEKIKLQAGIKGPASSDNKSKVFIPPYSIVTIIEEFTQPSFVFVDGNFKKIEPLGAGEEVDFGDPVGKMTVHYTIHSEPALVPVVFRDKGLRECSFQIGLPEEVSSAIGLFISAGFGMEGEVEIGSEKIAAPELLNLVIQENINRNAGALLEPEITPEVLRAHVTGTEKKKRCEIIADIVTPPGWNAVPHMVHAGTSIGLSVGLEMVHKNMTHVGVGGAEKMIRDYDYYIEGLEKKGFEFRVRQDSVD
jgi:saccharopine dehydrogenase-like NADP-dependent oxidoreductase